MPDRRNFEDAVLFLVRSIIVLLCSSTKLQDCLSVSTTETDLARNPLLLFSQIYLSFVVSTSKELYSPLGFSYSAAAARVASVSVQLSMVPQARSHKGSQSWDSPGRAPGVGAISFSNSNFIQMF